MVFQSNYARRAPNAENVHPRSSKRRSSLRISIQSASRRRRARTAGPTNHSPRYVAEQAMRRSMTRSPTAGVRFDVAREANDVDMRDIEAAAGPTSMQKGTPITLPRYLARPDFREIKKETITAIDCEFSDIPLQYIQEGLESTGPAMMKVLASVEATPVNNTLPTDLCITINDQSCDMPTHMVAVYSRHSSASPNPTRRVTLYPIHNIILALHCAHLPTLPKSTASEPDSVGQMTIPVVPLCIPSPETFSKLSAYLYTKEASWLLATLLPTGTLTPASILSLDYYIDGNSPELQQYQAKLRTTYTPHALLMYAVAINGLWRNVCALGVFDDQLWEVMDLAWEAIIGALNWKEGAPEETL